MRDWDAGRIAAAAGARVVRDAPAGPARATVDSRAGAAGDLFVGIAGARVDGGTFAADALAAGAWGVLVGPAHARADLPGGGAVLAVPDPTRALGLLARAWRRELGAAVIGVTGSVGKTSTKDIAAAIVGAERVVAASRANFNTEIGLPLELLAAPSGTEVVVLELAMRGAGQIAELAAICEPDVGVVTNIGPVHLELLGSLEAIAAAKGELLRALGADGHGIVPAGEALLAEHLPTRVTTFGPGGDVRWEGDRVVAREDRLDVTFAFTAPHQRTNALAAVAASLAVGVRPSGPVEVAFSPLRGELVTTAGGVVVIDDCYNANPLSMRAALDDLAAQDTAGRRVAVLGDMLELGPEEDALHREIGAWARHSGVELLIAVGPRSAAMADAFDGEAHHVPDAAAAAALAARLVADGDRVLVKGSRGIGLEVVARELVTRRGPA